MKKEKISEDNKLNFQKLLVGHFVENVPEDCNKKIIYLMQGDGLWEIRKNKLGTFKTQLFETNIQGLKKTIEEPGWELNVPLIPYKLWEMTISFFKEVQKVHDAEAYLQFFYDSEKEEYVLHCPQQEVSKASVKYKTDPEFENDKYIFVMEIHSHGTMSAFFSGTDNEDEKSDRFYGVIGKIKNSYPEFKFRLILGNRQMEIDLFDLFEEKQKTTYPSDWLERIKKPEVKFKNAPLKKGKNYFAEEDDYEIWGEQIEIDAFNEEMKDFSLINFLEKYEER